MAMRASRNPAQDKRALRKNSRIDASRSARQTLDKVGAHRVPVPVEHVAAALGLTVERGRFGDDISGLLVMHDGRGIIGVNADHAATRQRFTIAHEIGHFVLHRNAMQVFIDHQFFTPYLAAFRDGTSSTGSDRLEREANAYAAELLMPADLLGHAVAGLELEAADEEVIATLASRFQVSKQAMTIRLVNLDKSDGPGWVGHR